MREVLETDQLDEIQGTGVGLQATHIQHYEQSDAPFYYGRIARLSYLISHKDLYGG